jgi:hypothetical protein
MDTQNTSVEQAIARIKAIDWNQDNSNTRQISHIKLFREHVRRTVLWFRALDLDFKGSGWPSVDIAARIDTSLIDEGRDEDRDEELIKLLGVSGHGYAIRYFPVCYVHWAMVQNRPEIMQIALPAPYEPVIMMFERGCRFPKREFDLYNFWGGGIPLGRPESYYDKAPYTDLDSAALDREDIEYEKSRPKYNAEALS